MTINKSKTGISLSINELIECVNFVIDNNFIDYKGKLYRQSLGIPMGTSCGPCLANLFLYVSEEAYITKLIDEGKGDIAKSISNIYIDTKMTVLCLMIMVYLSQYINIYIQ